MDFDNHLNNFYGLTKATRNNDKDYFNTPVWKVKLPENIYALAIMSPLWITKKPGLNFESIMGIGLFWIFAYLCFLIQSTCIYFVSEMTSDLTTCSPSNNYLSLISLLCFSSLIWVDIFETFKLSTYIHMLPETNFIDGMLVENIKFDCSDNGIGFIENNNSGISKLYKRCVFFLILLPKWLIASFLWYYGCKFILFSQNNETVLLNSVSLNFLLEIDDYLYKSIISDYVKITLIEDWPELAYTRGDFNLPKNHISASCKNRYGFWSAWSQIILPSIISFFCTIAKIIICK